MELVKHDQSTKFHLDRHDVTRVRAAASGKEIICEQGILWITRAGDPKDHVLMPGEHLVINQGGRVVIEAMREARVQIVSAENAN